MNNLFSSTFFLKIHLTISKGIILWGGWLYRTGHSQHMLLQERKQQFTPPLRSFIIKAQTLLPSRFQVSCPTMANKNLATESNTATGHRDDGQKRRTTSILKSHKSAWKIGELSFKDIIKLFTCVKSKCERLYVFSNVVFH